MVILFFGGILEGIKQSWHFITSSVERGLTSVQSYVQARRGGLAVTEAHWKAGVGLYEEAKEAWEKIMDIPGGYKISEEFSIASPFDWRRQHVMKMKIHGFDTNTGEQIEQWITVESDTELSKYEWLNRADAAVTDSPFGYSYEIGYVSEYEYYQKGS